ncbi:putative sodium-coupled neutral amino acid transporter 10 isoform X4 [Mastomys coucha]|uniref:putative sodium-coupled neutral amino acid transporter 10 isoform X4 n=1 Tax=Mastomys coucha TaxID=35658 RepID=UPI001261E10E|nr:putative sodium-coupled neutral amino acid transporter 10 isoform X4 [Mastomys coucha]
MTAASTSKWGLVTNVVNSIVGVSVLTMPFCFKQCGIVLGALLLVFCSWMTHQSCMFLVKSASLSKRRTYAGLAFHAYGKAGKMLVETSMIGLMLGSCITFYVVIGDLGSNFFAPLLGLQVTRTFRVFLLFAVSLFIVLPLSLQRNMMASIQSFSAMALLFYTVFMVVIMLSSFKHGLFSGQWLQRVSYIRWEGVFRCVPIFGMSFACQSQVLPTYDSLDEPSVKTMSSIFAYSLNVVTAFYVMVGFFGYVSFTDATTGNVLIHFPSNPVTEMIRVGFVMSVAVGFPMMILPCRQALNTLLFEQQQKDGTFAAGGYMPPLRFKVLTLSVVFGTMVGGVMIPNVETILGFTGATMGSLICFICPALIYKKAQKNAPSAQVVLWVGLGILVVSTLTTLSASEEAPLDLTQEARSGRRGDAEGAMKVEAARLSVQDPIVVVAEDSQEKLKPAEDKEVLEQAQIKGPVDVPGGEAPKEKQEAAQLDRPGQGIAVPMGEAHRHEPPIPHDKVVVDEGQDQEGPEEKKPPPRLPDEGDPAGRGQVPPPLPESEKEKQEPERGEERKRPERVLAVGETEHPQKAPQANGQPPVQPRKEDSRPGNRDLHPVPQARVPVELNAPVAGEGKGPAQKAGGAPWKPVESAAESNVGGKAGLPVQRPEAAEQREKKEAEQPGGDQAGSKLEAGRAEMLDHAVLLQVIKEQQVQQKRLLDQQEKLLAVIEEQHKEIRQQRQEGEEDKPKPDMQPEPGVAVPRGQEEEAEPAQETLEDDPSQPLQPEVGAPRGRPALSQDMGQHPLGEVKVLPGRELGDLPAGGSDKEPQGALTKLREDQKGAAFKVAGALRELVPGDMEPVHKTDPAELPKSPEKQLAKEAARQHQDVFGEGSQERKETGKEAMAPGADTQKEAAQPLVGAEAEDSHTKSRQPTKVPVTRPAGMGFQAQARFHPEPQAIFDTGQDSHPEIRSEAPQVVHIPPEEQHRGKGGAAVHEAKQRPDPNSGPGGQKPENAKPNRDLKVQAGSDLRRRRRDLASHPEQELAPKDGVIISFNSLPNVQVNDLRSALDTQLRQAAGAALQVVHSRQIKQLSGDLEEA